MPKYNHKPDPPNTGDKYWLIKTRTHYGHAYWRPDGKGYTPILCEAGLFSRDKAHTDRDDDVAIPLSHVIEDIKSQIKEYEDRISKGRDLLFKYYG